MSRKVIIYLDTQDFSRFADCLSNRGTKDAGLALEALLPEIDAGRVIAPISMAHISELFQYEDGGRDLVLRKAQAIERLSWPYAFRDMNDMIVADFVDFAVSTGCLRQRPPRPASFPVDEEGQWHPSVGSILDDVQAQMDRRLNAALKEEHGLSRADRRKAKKVMRSYGWGEALTTPEAEKQMREFANKYPVTDRFINEKMFQRLLQGKLKADVVEAEIFKGIRRPTDFVCWYFERYEGERDLPHWMRTLGGEIAASLRTLKSEVSELDIPPAALKSILKEQADLFGLSISKRLFSEAVPVLQRLGVGARAIDKLLNDPGRASTPTIAALATLAVQAMKKHSKSGQNAPEVKNSDGGDMIHALYMPHCDIWRGDKDSAEFVRQAFPSAATHIVGKLKDLPSALEAALAKAKLTVPSN